MKKRIALLFLVILSATTMAACSGSGHKDQLNAGGVSNQETAQKEQANLELVQTVFDAAKSELMNGNYDAALDGFKEAEYIISKTGVEGFDDIESYKYACNYYRVSEYLKGFSYSAEYKVNELFSLFGADCGDNGLLFNFEGTVYISGRNIRATFHNFMIAIPAPDKSAPTIPETIKWTYAASDVLGGFTQIAKASGTFDPKEWFTVKKETAGGGSIGTNIEILEMEGDEEHLQTYLNSYCLYLGRYLNNFLQASELGTTEDLGIKNIVAAQSELRKNN